MVACRANAEGQGERLKLTKLGPESQERLALFNRDPGKIRCHSDLLIFHQEWTLGLCLQEDLLGLFVPEKTRNGQAGPPEVIERGRPTLCTLWSSSGGEIRPVSSGNRL
ncbi:hypothetical protein NDU88_001325 [Pleurodeles waltl]|uniref:Uncharacterized protein n=1 Tax=Pleurodeles waltl TaxID=8319 RepID=A0AAV7L986_PLEWA|nr:hypothetical protein NDU88_001325 [Pleurodeles waltl]